MLRHVVSQKFPYVSEVLTAFIIREMNAKTLVISYQNT
jgi:hypothetical protein